MSRQIFIFLVVILWSVLPGSFSVSAQAKCGQTNCTGLCGRFTDQNGDGFCDLGFVTNFKPDTSAKKAIRDTVKKITKNTSKKSDISQVNKISLDASTSSQSQDSSQNIAKTDNTQILQNEKSEKNQNKKTYPYDLVLISCITLGLYCLTFALHKTGKIRKQIHRRIWNSLLLLTFLGSGIIGLLLVIQINYHVWLGIYRDFLYWHVQLGIAMALISILHALWHISYYKKLFSKLPKIDPEC